VSVVNKMLRDLDQRQVSRPAEAALGRPSFVEVLHQGTHSVPVDGSSVSMARTGRRIGLVGVVCVALAFFAWYAMHSAPQGADAVVLTPPLVIAPAPVTVQGVVAAPQPTIAAKPQAPVAQAMLPENVPAPLALAPSRSTKLVMQPAVSPPLMAPRFVADTGPVPAVSLRMESMLLTHPALGAAVQRTAQAPAKTANPMPDTAPGLQRQQQASADALSQAQILWSAGSHAAAIDLMQQAVDAAERSVKAGSSPPGNPVLLSLVREWTRMQMAQNRYGAVWDMLSRLEPVLGNAPDLWGLRGNTAQRLGRHSDSVHAYTVALQSRPNEQRWMLGAAVSMAALGQTDQAAAMAEKAQGVGDISREVQTYLHQMGVSLKPR
jgi:MSHA biogenesis protein MshN